MVTKKQLEDLNFTTYNNYEFICDNEWYMFCVKTQNLYSFDVRDGKVEFLTKITNAEELGEVMTSITM